jgi:hypothetical protein
MILVRPDQHVAWRGNRMDEARQAEPLLKQFLGAPT